MMSLSARFSSIQVNGVESSEDEKDPDDLELLQKLLGNRYKYSKPSALSFGLGRNDSLHSDSSESEDELQMNKNWRKDFENSLRKNKQNKEGSKTNSCLKIPEKCTSITNGVLRESGKFLENINLSNDENVQECCTRSPINEEITDFIQNQVTCEKQEKSAIEKENDVDRHIEPNDEKSEITEIQEQSKLSEQMEKPVVFTTSQVENAPEVVNNTSEQKQILSEKKANQSKMCKKKDAKNKKYDIKPAFSFPLDELLPANKPDENAKSSTSRAGLQNSAEHNSTAQNRAELENYNKNQFQSSPGTEDTCCFHGIVYTEESNCVQIPVTVAKSADHITNIDNKNDLVEETENVLADPTACKESLCDTVSSDEHSSPYEFMPSKPLSSFLEAMQYGNKIAIQKIQAALNEQISKTRIFEENSGKENIIDNASNFGFYKERINLETEVESPEERSEELFQQFVQQVSCLVKTEEDKAKVTSLLKMLKEKGGRLTGTGFTPPDMNSITPSPVEAKSKVTSVQTAPGSQSVTKDDPLKELFEGRTLLKGGVDPRHIPKTFIYRSGKCGPKDPRALPKKGLCEISLKLPKFYESFFNETKRKERKIPYNAKDPRCMRMLSDEPEKLDVKSENQVDLKHSLKLTVDTTSKTEGHGENSPLEVTKTDLPESPFENEKSPIDSIVNQNIPVIIGHSSGSKSPDSESDTSSRISVLHSVQLVDENEELERTKEMKLTEHTSMCKKNGDRQKPVDNKKVEVSTKITKTIINEGAKADHIEGKCDKADLLQKEAFKGIGKNYAIGSKGAISKSMINRLGEHPNTGRSKPLAEKSAEKKMKDQKIISNKVYEKSCSENGISGQRFLPRVLQQRRELEFIQSHYSSKPKVYLYTPDKHSCSSKSTSDRPEHYSSKTKMYLYTPDKHSSLSKSLSDRPERVGEPGIPRDTDRIRRERDSRARESRRSSSSSRESRSSRESSKERVRDDLTDLYKKDTKPIDLSFKYTKEQMRYLRCSFPSESRKRHHTSKDSSFEGDDKKRKHERLYSHGNERTMSGLWTAKYHTEPPPLPGTSKQMSREDDTPRIYYSREVKPEGEMDLSDEEIKQEFKLKFTKPDNDDNQDGKPLNLGNKGGKKLPYKFGGIKTAKDLKQIEDDRKFLESIKSKLQPITVSKEVNNEKPKTQNPTTATKPIDKADKPLARGVLSYNDMLYLADLEEDSKT